MDVILDRPLQTVTPSVDGDVLEVLARADAWFSVSRVQGMMRVRRSTEGIRRVLARLVDQGVVLRLDSAATPVYQLNRKHLAAQPIIALASLRSALLDRIREQIAHWPDPPRYAAVFGSGARGGMRDDSDIDLFLVADSTDRLWESGVEHLVSDIRDWTGNSVGLLMYDTAMIRGRSSADPVLASVADDGVFLVGERTAFRKQIEGPRGR